MRDRRDVFARRGNRLRELQAFCHAATAGSMTAAAERLDLTQPSVSLAVRRLETDLGVELFERSGPRIRLTEAGQALLEVAMPIVDGVDNLPALLAERASGRVGGELRIAAGDAVILYLLPSLIRAYRQRFPDVRVHLVNVSGEAGLALLRSNEVDLAVRPMLEVPADMTWRPLIEYLPVLITPRGHPLAEARELTLADICRHPLVLPPRALTTWRLVDMRLRQEGLSYEVALEAGGWEVIKEYVAAGLGVGIVTSLCVRGDERLSVRSLERFFPARHYGVVLRRGKRLGPAASRFVTLLEEHAGRPPGAPGAGGAGR